MEVFVNHLPRFQLVCFLICCGGFVCLFVKFVCFCLWFVLPLKCPLRAFSCEIIFFWFNQSSSLFAFIDLLCYFVSF